MYRLLLLAFRCLLYGVFAHQAAPRFMTKFGLSNSRSASNFRGIDALLTWSCVAAQLCMSDCICTNFSAVDFHDPCEFIVAVEAMDFASYAHLVTTVQILPFVSVVLLLRQLGLLLTQAHCPICRRSYTLRAPVVTQRGLANTHSQCGDPACRQHIRTHSPFARGLPWRYHSIFDRFPRIRVQVLLYLIFLFAMQNHKPDGSPERAGRD